VTVRFGSIADICRTVVPEKPLIYCSSWSQRSATRSVSDRRRTTRSDLLCGSGRNPEI